MHTPVRTCLLVAALAAARLAATPAAAQVTLQVRQGTSWASTGTFAPTTPATLRWRWSGGSLPSRATWQLAIGGTVRSPVVKEVALRSPAAGQYAEFALSADNVPLQAPAGFRVRVRIEQGRTVSTSSWVPLTMTTPTVSKADVILADVGCQLFAVGTAPQSPFGGSGLPDFKVLEEDGLWSVKDYAIPPDLVFLLRVFNRGQRSATFTVALTTTNDGVRDISTSQSVTVAAGAELYLEDFKSTRVTEWGVGQNNRIVATSVLDVNNLVKELVETNNGCRLAFTVYIIKT